MAVKIALAGNPNSGKTTLFNALTGANQFVGNWPGVTVEKKEGKLKGHQDVIITVWLFLLQNNSLEKKSGYWIFVFLLMKFFQNYDTYVYLLISNM